MNELATSRNEDQLLEELRRLGPWHFDVRLTDSITTAQGNSEVKMNARSPNNIRSILEKIYPNGLVGKSLMDAGCNGGGYCIVAKQMGADYVLGFDAREHWVDQGNFLKSTLGLTGIDFAIKTLPNVDLPQKFDICLFSGVFYHLPDPMHALEVLCDHTNDVILISTETEGERGEYCMRLNLEGARWKDWNSPNLMSGVHGLAWWPSGPDLLKEILSTYGFAASRELWWHLKDTPDGRKNAGRCQIIAARDPALLQAFPDRMVVPQKKV